MRYLCVFTLLGTLPLPLMAGEPTGQDQESQAKVIAKQLSSRIPEEKLTGLQAAAECQEHSLLAPITKLIRDSNLAVRMAAIEALGQRATPADMKRASSSLAARIKPLERKPEAKPELLAIIQALHDLAQLNALKPLTDNIPWDSDREVGQKRLMAAGNIPSREVIERLIQVGASGRRHVAWRRNACKAALRYATQEKSKRSIEQWRSWWRENKRTFDPVIAAEKREEARKQAAEKDRRRQEKRNRRKKNKHSAENG